ncbi:MAG: hypothetical protein Q4F88_06915 [Eubacteriales bacterium]|nr:hypothetical protein [Eubacteriales bacterium]MDO5564941.1 hypothetical protein [Eubacteriales bacterium]
MAYDNFHRKFADGYGHRGNDRTIQKSIRIDRYTYDVIDSFDGIGFSEKLREYIRIAEIIRTHPDYNKIKREVSL